LNSKEKGRISENIAKNYLISKGYKLVGKNFRTRSGEIDLVMFDKKSSQFVFVEVKSLKDENTISICETISRRKAFKIKQTANFWIQTKIRNSCQWRIDFIGIVLDNMRVVHIQSAIA